MKEIPYTRLWQLIAKLPRKELEELDAFIHALLARPQREPTPKPKTKEKGKAKGKAKGGGKEEAILKRRGAVTLRVEHRRCGKDCRCNDGKGHGPYLYAYWWEEGRTRSKYLGKAG